MTVRILLADDHKIFRQGLRTMLEEEADLSVVGDADSGRAALEQVAALHPDVVVMDVSLPDASGIEVTRRMVGDSPKTRVIALSMHVEHKFVAEMLKAGASGYLCKKCEAGELLNAIKVVHAGQTYISPDVCGDLIDQYVRAPSSESVSALGSLTSREREILLLLVKGMSIKMIAAELSVSIKTVHVHRERLMEKLKVQSIAGLTKFAIREGLIVG